MSLRLRTYGLARGEDEQVSLARFATQLARTLGTAGHFPRRLDVQADISAPKSQVGDERGSLTLRVRADATGLDNADLAQITTRTAQEWPSWASLSQTVETDVAQETQVTPKPARAVAVTAPVAAAAPAAAAPRKAFSMPRPPAVRLPRQPLFRTPAVRLPRVPSVRLPRFRMPRASRSGGVQRLQAFGLGRLLRGGLAVGLVAGAVIAVVVAVSQPAPAPIDPPGVPSTAQPTAPPTGVPIVVVATPTTEPTPAAEPTPPMASTAEPTATSPPPATSTPAPESTSTPVPAATSTPAPAPTSTPLPVATSTPVSRTVGDQSFAARGAVPNWPNDPNSTGWSTPEGYQLFARRAGEFVAIGNRAAQPLGDVVVTARFAKVGGPPGGGFGVIVRDQGPGARDGLSQTGNFYVLEVGDRGEVGIWRRAENTWIDLVPWTPSAAVRPGNAENELTVRAIGPRLTLLVNGVEAASVEDATFAAGTTGVFVGGDQNQVLLKQLTVEPPN